MAILVTNIKIGIDQNDAAAVQKAVARAGIAASHITGSSIYKKSLDARKQGNIVFVVSVLLQTDCDEQQVCEAAGSHDVLYRPEQALKLHKGTVKLHTPIVIAGFGPAGIFCAYLLAQQGYRPVVLERGHDVDRRVSAVEAFWSEGNLDAECNVQFGEGGAGTFSDGKLTTRISDSRCEYVLRLLVEHGAPKEILQTAKPHIGTDKLRGVIKRIREEIIAMGGRVLFDHKLEQVHCKNGQVCSVTVNGEQIAAEHLVVAVGHSARDTFSMLLKNGAEIIPKSFSVGMRIEHLQAEIDKGLYGRMAGHPNLPKGEYQLSYRENGRGVYTFCMCPGGTVVPSSSSEGTVVTNGMSEHNRDQLNANSAVVVSVNPSDFGTQPLDGAAFQLELEKKAFLLGGGNYAAVGATVGKFLQGKPGLDLKRVQPSYTLGVTGFHPEQLFPPFITDMMQKGIRMFDRKIHGFAANDAVLTGVETRTSSPLRIVRGGDYCSTRIRGLYPCGEGAGYAGGIMSAAVDGLKVAEQLISQYTME